MANNAIMIFDGTPSTVLTGATAVLADTTYSVSAATATYAEWDNSTDLWPLAKATFKGTFTAAPDSKSTLDLYYTENDLAGDTADDEVPPTTSDRLGARYVGSFVVPGVSITIQYNVQIIISTVGLQKGFFHLYNGGGDTLEITPNAWTVEIEGFTYTPST
jgi:hypothetical protein